MNEDERAINGARIREFMIMIINLRELSNESLLLASKHTLRYLAVNPTARMLVIFCMICVCTSV